MLLKGTRDRTKEIQKELNKNTRIINTDTSKFVNDTKMWKVEGRLEGSECCEKPSEGELMRYIIAKQDHVSKKYRHDQIKITVKCVMLRQDEGK